MSPSEFCQHLGVAIEKGSLLAPRQRVVVGVSGGPDSMALLHALRELSAERRFGWVLHAAHLHHGLRGAEADADAAFVKDAMERLRLGCTIERLEPDAVGAAGKGSAEEAARRLRYGFLERVCERMGAESVAVAHHADDRAETILHHAIRGTGMRGLRGMRAKRPLRPVGSIQLIRPLLGFRRTEVMAYLEDRKIGYCLDRTNERLDHTRNRIRHRILPMLCEEMNPRAVEALLRLGDQAGLLECFVSAQAERLLASLTVSRVENLLEISSRELAGQPRALQLEVVRQAVSGFGLGERALNFAHLSAVCDMIDGSDGVGGMDLPGRLHVRREADGIVFSIPQAPSCSGTKAAGPSIGDTRVTCIQKQG